MIDPATCLRCGKRRPWATSKLSVHAACYFTPAEQDALYARFAADPKLTQKRLADELGITIGVVLVTLHEAKKRRGLAVGGRR